MISILTISLCISFFGFLELADVVKLVQYSRMAANISRKKPQAHAGSKPLIVNESFCQPLAAN